MPNPPFTLYLEELRSRLRQPLPGIEAQRSMAPPIRPVISFREAKRNACRDASVLIALFPLIEVPALVLTVRPDHLPEHPGQISLPGGRREQGESLVDTALREAEEEVFLPREEIEVLGELTPLYIPPSNYCVHPFVGVMPYAPSLRAAETEVADILQVRLPELLDPGCIRSEIWDLHGHRVSVPFFFVRGYKIWGATAMILAEFLALFGEMADLENSNQPLR